MIRLARRCSSLPFATARPDARGLQPRRTAVARRLAFRGPPGTPAPASGRRLTPAASPSPQHPSPDPASLPQTHDVPARAGRGVRGAARRALGRHRQRRSRSGDAVLLSARRLPAGQGRAPIPRPTGSTASSPRTGATSTRCTRASGPDAGDAKLVAFDVPESRGRWVEPGEEWNKIGYYRVFGPKLRYAAGGEEHSFDVKSLISWRGEWFVVHLSAIG